MEAPVSTTTIAKISRDSRGPQRSLTNTLPILLATAELEEGLSNNTIAKPSNSTKCQLTAGKVPGEAGGVDKRREKMRVCHNVAESVNKVPHGRSISHSESTSLLAKIHREGNSIEASRKESAKSGQTAQPTTPLSSNEIVQPSKETCSARQQQSTVKSV